ncbi:MAG: hypothetical protein R3C17_16455 [Planctomycetaceae bacterium]
MLLGTGLFELDNSQNNIANLAGSVTNSISYRDIDSLTIGTISSLFPNVATNGVTTTNSDILISAGGIMTLNQQVNAGTADVRLVADGDITQSATGVITADELGVRQESAAGGNILLGDNNDVNTLAASNAFSTGVITFNDADDLVIGSVSAQSSDGVSFAVTNGVSTTNGDILLNANGILTLNQQVNAGTADARLVADGDITQSATGVITADELGVRQESAAGGNILLGDNNDVNTLAASNAFSTGVITFNDADDLVIGSVSAQSSDGVSFAVTNGVSTTNGDILLNANGILTLNQQVNAGTADVRLVADGDITQSATGVITADELGVRQESAAGGNILLGDNNDVNTLAASNAFATGVITFNDTDDLVIGSVSAQSSDGVSFAVTNGVSTTNGDILLNANGFLTLNQQINAGTADVRLVADGDITQSATGVITADELGVRQESAAGGNILLGDNNDVNTLAASNAFATGVITFNDTDDLVIGSVSAQSSDGVSFAVTNGVSTTNGDILLNANGFLTLNQQINAGTADVRLVADGDITQSATGVITADELGVRQESAAGGNILLGDNNDVNTLAASNAFSTGVITFNDTDDLVIGSVSAQSSDGVSFAVTNGVSTTNGDILLNANGILTLNQQINAGTADARLVADGNITQSATGVITADELGVRQESAAGGNILLGDNNDVNTLAASNAFSTGVITFNDADDLVIGSVSAQSSDGVSFAVTNGVSTTNGDILLNANGFLTLNQQINAGTADARLVADGNITQSATGVITADELGVRQESAAGGNILLGDNNDVNTLAASNAFSTGVITFNDVDDLVIGSVSAQSSDGVSFAVTNGVSTTNGDILLNANGILTLNQQINAGTADARLVADGNITQSATGVITADELGVRQESAAGGNILLGDNNDVNTLAASNAFSTGVITFNDADDLVIGSVSAQSSDGVSFAVTNGVSTTNGDILLNANGFLTLNQQINAGTADARLVADGNITQSATGVITADELGVRQESAAGGNILLGDNNDVNTLAASNAFSTGVITFNDTDDLVIGSVSAQTSDGVSFAVTNGVSTTNGDILLNANGFLTLNQQVNAGTADARLVADGNITQSATGLITADELGVRQESAAGGNILLGDNNDVNTLAASNAFATGVLTFNDADDLVIGSVSAQSSDGVSFAVTNGVSTTNGDILLNANGILTLNQQVNAGTADARLVADGDITQSATGVITADELGVRQESAAGGNILLGDNNDVNTLAASNAFATGVITFNDADDLTIGLVAAQASDGVSFAVTNGVSTTNGDILLNANGFLTLNQQINAGTADVRLVADGDITQSATGVITADELGVRQEATTVTVANDTDTNGQFDILLGQSNDVTVASFRNRFGLASSNLGGSIVFSDVNDLTIGSVIAQTLDGVVYSATSGVVSLGHNAQIRLTSDGNLTVNQNVEFFTDTDEDGITDSLDVANNDPDMDGLTNDVDPDIDNDGILNKVDTDPAPPGVFLTNESITLTSANGNVTLSNGVRISTDQNFIALVSSNSTSDSIRIVAGVQSDLSTDAPDAQNQITLTSVAGFAVGDVISVNDGDSPSQVFTINSISGNTLTLSGNLNGSFTTDQHAFAEHVVGDIIMGNDITIRTDGGVAHQFAQRPVLNMAIANTAFVELLGGPFNAVINNQVLAGLTEFLNVWQLEIGALGEENLRLDIDWRDPINNPITGLANTTNPVETGGTPLNSDRTQTFYLDAGTNRIGHVYTLDDLIAYKAASVTSFLSDFSVSQHDSIQVSGGTVSQNGFTEAVQNGRISSTDNIGTPAVFVPDSSVIDDVESNNDFHFEGGLLKMLIPTVFLPPLEPEPSPPAPPSPPVAAPAPVIPVLVNAAPVEVADTPFSSYSTQSQDYFQLRVFDGETRKIVEKYEHIADEFGELLLQPARLKQWVADENLGDQTGLELWLITEKRTANGAVTVERPVLKFDIANGQPFPAKEDMPKVFEELHLSPMPLDDNLNPSATESSEISAPAVDGTSSDTDNQPQNRESTPPEASGDEANGSQSLLIPSNDAHKKVSIDEEADVTVSSTLNHSVLMSVAVASVLNQPRPGSAAPSKSRQLLNRILNRQR